MSDTVLSLGKKMREIRIKRGMTQRELAGDKISRNMLSLIENDAASPSVSTLTYLAARLGVPAGYFIPRDSDEEERLMRLTSIGELRSAYSKKDWNKCIEMCPESVCDDEISYILASAHLALSLDAASAFDIPAAIAELETAEKYACGSVYCGEVFDCALRYHRRLIDFLATDDIPPELCDPSGCGEHLDHGIIAYFTALKDLREGEENITPPPSDPYHTPHLKAVELSMEEEYPEAIRLLRKLSDDPALPCYMRYRVLCDLERAASLSGNVRLAYSTSKQKIELIDKCRTFK